MTPLTGSGLRTHSDLELSIGLDTVYFFSCQPAPILSRAWMLKFLCNMYQSRPSSRNNLSHCQRSNIFLPNVPGHITITGCSMCVLFGSFRSCVLILEVIQNCCQWKQFAGYLLTLAEPQNLRKRHDLTEQRTRRQLAAKGTIRTSGSWWMLL